MTSSDDSSERIDWSTLVASVEYHDVARFVRGAEQRIYRLRVLGQGADLWRVSDTEGGPQVSMKESHFNTADEAGLFLGELKRALRAGGWTAV